MYATTEEIFTNLDYWLSVWNSQTKGATQYDAMYSEYVQKTPYEEYDANKSKFYRDKAEEFAKFAKQSRIEIQNCIDELRYRISFHEEQFENTPEQKDFMQECM